MRRRGTRPAETLGGADSDYEHLFLSAWGLHPDQWRPVGSMALIRQRAAFIWRIDGPHPVEDVSLRARRAYDRLGELGTTISAESTAGGIEVVLPLGRVAIAMKTLAALSILPDAVRVEDAPPAQLRELRRCVAGFRPQPELLIGGHERTDALAVLRAAARRLA
jgi:hypothetical protein